MKATDYETVQAVYDAAVVLHGFDYEESRLSDAEYAEADPKRVRQYELGILTGGEFDCLTRHGVLPVYLTTH